MGSGDPREVITQLTRELAGQNEALFPDEHGRRDADTRLAQDIVAAIGQGVASGGGNEPFRVFEATCLERARGGFHVNIAVLQPPGDTRRAPLKAVTVAQVMIEPGSDPSLQTTVSVRSTRAGVDPWRPPPDVKYDKARKTLSELEQTIVAARSMRGANEPWQPLPAFHYDPITKQWLGATERVVDALSTIIRGWMAARADGPPPPSSLTTTETHTADVSG